MADRVVVVGADEVARLAGGSQARGRMRPMSSAAPEATTSREFTTIGVVGLGTMGAGIAEVFARNGFAVVGVEVNDESLERGRQHLEHSTERAVKRGKLSEEDQRALLDRVTFTTSMKDLADADFVVEAVVESIEVKKSIFRDLEAIVKPEAILATNTSSLSVTEISTANAHPGRVIGVHFFNPAPVQSFVEIIRTVVTEPDVLDDVKSLVERLGKNPVVCGDRAGFIANTLLFGYLNHAASMYEARFASREDIDAAMRYGCGYPMGPLALLDLIGLDTAYEILDTMYKQGRDRLHAPTPILKQLVTAGFLGRKTGRGFYTYEGPDSPVVVADAHTPSPDDKPQLVRPISRIGVVGTGTMATGIVEVFARAGYDVTYVGRAPAKVDGVRATIERSLDKAIQRGKLEESREAGGARPPDRHHQARRPRGRRPRGRGDRRGPRGQDHAVREPRRDLQARRDPGHDHQQPADHLVRHRDQASAGRHRHALLQPRSDHEAGRGGLHRHHRRRRHARPCSRCASRSARWPSRAATGPGSSSTRCCSPTSTTR